MDYLECFQELRDSWPSFIGGHCRLISKDLGKIVHRRHPNYNLYLAYAERQKRVPWLNHQILVVNEDGAAYSAMDAATSSRSKKTDDCWVISADTMPELVEALEKFYEGKWELENFEPEINKRG